MIHKFVFLGLFILGVILTFTITNSMLSLGIDSITGPMKAADKRFAYSLISLFGLTGYFVEVILERLGKGIKKEDSTKI